MVLLKSWVFNAFWFYTAVAAPALCNYTCPLMDRRDQRLVTQRHTAAIGSPYSIFECVWVVAQSIWSLSRSQSTFDRYSLSKSAQTHTCSYEKVQRGSEQNVQTQLNYLIQVTGFEKLGYKVDDCHSEALKCSQAFEPASVETQVEVPPWVESGRFQLYLKGHYP